METFVLESAALQGQRVIAGTRELSCERRREMRVCGVCASRVAKPPHRATMFRQLSGLNRYAM